MSTEPARFRKQADDCPSQKPKKRMENTSRLDGRDRGPGSGGFFSPPFALGRFGSVTRIVQSSNRRGTGARQFAANDFLISPSKAL